MQILSKSLLGIMTALFLVFFTACTSSVKNSNDPKLFTLLSSEKTHIDFQNTLTEGLNTNVLMYEYFYNGGGVATGDLNGDGLPDIYFTGNMVDNKLYINKGNMEFDDATDPAGVAGRPGPWKTGVTLVDINADNRLDIYVCYSGKLRGEKRMNQLFINEGNIENGIPHFSEQAQAFGLADSSFSTQAYFFDYDKDSDLDMFLLNHNPNSAKVLDEATTLQYLHQINPMTGVRLYKNEKNHFTDVTEQSGISSSSLTYGLGAAIADINGDGWQDMYISNDYTIPDYLYLNNHDGTFTNRIQQSMGHITQFSMGNAVTDINNDTKPDIYTLDMLPEDNRRQKLLFAPDNYEKFALTVNSGFHYQYMRNMLQLNNGDGSFSEIGQFSGISNTDWSWAPLFADYDNDGWKDLFVTNGYTRDYTNMDFLKYYADFMKTKTRFRREDALELVNQMPASIVPKYIFKNNGNLTFTNMANSWGFAQQINGNGAAYADLDNDGDLDLVVNNINAPAFIYQNDAQQQKPLHYLQIKLKGEAANTQGLGAKVFVYTKDGVQYAEQMPATGYLSTVSSILHFGIGKNELADSIKICWLSGRQQILGFVKANQQIEVREKEAALAHTPMQVPNPIFIETISPVSYQHQQGAYYDFKQQPLLTNPLSFFGPCLVKGDVNKDGLEDLFVGGGIGNPGIVCIQNEQGKFIPQTIPALVADKKSQDADAVFFDANADGFTDLYVASGGYATFAPNDSRLQDRLYVNDGKGNFVKDNAALPPMLVSKSCVRVADINDDGYPDLFVGGRVIPGRYPEAPRSYILINNGKGHFTDQTAALAPALQTPGMVTDAIWYDINADKKEDLIIAGEWMPLTVFVSNKGRLENNTLQYFDKPYSGWWNKLLLHDFTGDGKPELIAGNFGLNTQCKASDKEPAEMYFKDFDANGAVDPLFCFYIQGKSYPYVTRDELLDQMTVMRSRYTDYKSYADETIHTLFSRKELQDAGRLQANEFSTCYFEMGTNGKFHPKNLPPQVQFAPVFAMLPLDYDKDGKQDLMIAGNIHNARLRFGNSDANYGILLKGNGKGGFEYISQPQSGFKLIGDVRSLQQIKNTIYAGINGGFVKAYSAKKHDEVHRHIHHSNKLGFNRLQK